MNPPVLRAPNGVVQDGLEFFGAGKAYYDPSKITVPTLLIGAEWDKDAPPYMGQTLFPLLVNAPGKRLVQLAEGHAHHHHGKEPHDAVRGGTGVPRRSGSLVASLRRPRYANPRGGDVRFVPIADIDARITCAG